MALTNLNPTIADPRDILKLLMALRQQTPGEMPNSIIPLLMGLGMQRTVPQAMSPQMLQMLSPPGRQLAGIR